RTAGQFVMGPDSCTAQGDPISARWLAPGRSNPARDLAGGRYTYRIHIPQGFSEDLAVQLFDPDSLNLRQGISDNYVPSSAEWGTGFQPKSCSGGMVDNGDVCLMVTGEQTEDNPVWLRRVD